MSKTLVFLVMLYFSCSISFAGEGDCHTFLYYRDHPEECLSKEEVKQYRSRQLEQARQAEKEERAEQALKNESKKLSNKNAPPKKLINTLIENCIKKRTTSNDEIRDGSIEISSEDRTLSELDKLNGMTYAKIYKINFIHRIKSDTEWRKATDWEYGFLGLNALIKNGILSFTGDSSILLVGQGSVCEYTVDMSDPNAEIVDKKRVSLQPMRPSSNPQPNDDNDAASREAPRQAFIKKIKGE